LTTFQQEISSELSLALALFYLFKFLLRVLSFVPSVTARIGCLSACLSHSPTTAACGGFAAVGPAGRRYQSIAAWPAPQQHGAAAANAGSATFTAGGES